MAAEDDARKNGTMCNSATCLEIQTAPSRQKKPERNEARVLQTAIQGGRFLSSESFRMTYPLPYCNSGFDYVFMAMKETSYPVTDFVTRRLLPLRMSVFSIASIGYQKISPLRMTDAVTL